MKKNNSRSSTKEKFNTSSHTPSSLRNVGPGYDDTGKGGYTKANETGRTNKRKEVPGKIGSRVDGS